MTITYKYKNIFKEELTQRQAEESNDSFEREYYVDGVLKKVDYYDDNVISYGAYYLSPEEGLQDLLEEFKDIWGEGKFYISERFINGFSVRDYEVYKQLTLIRKGVEVYNNSGQIIAAQKLDINTLSAIKTTKVFYLQNLGKFPVDDIMHFGTFEFDYNYYGLNPGEIKVLVNLTGFDHRDYYIRRKDNILLHPMIAEIFSWDEQTYYHAAEPLIPNGK